MSCQEYRMLCHGEAPPICIAQWLLGSEPQPDMYSDRDGLDSGGFTFLVERP